MDKRKSILNVSVSIGSKLLLLIGTILVRRYLIRYVGNEVNGLNSLYISIVSFLSVAELGVGTAITFCMYKPIVEGDNETVSALYNLFTKLYYFFGGIVLIAGIALMPFLKFLVKDYSSINENLYMTFGSMLISVVLLYMFSAKTSLINAYKNNYITTVIHSSGLALQYVLQIIIVVYTGSFSAYLACRIVSAVLQWGVTELIARKKYYGIIHNMHPVLSDEMKGEVVKNIKAMFMHKIGALLVNTTDSVIISTFFGVVILGKYANYTTIVSSMIGVLALFFTPLTSIIGHLWVEKGVETTNRYYNFFYSFNYIIGVVFFLGYYAVIDPMIQILFGNDLQLSRTVTFVITLSYFIQFMRNATILFRDATGTFYNDRWKSLLEGLTNAVLSVLMVQILPNESKVCGVLVATIITNLFICHLIEPFVLQKYAFRKSPKNFYLKNYSRIAAFAAMLLTMSRFLHHYTSPIKELLRNGVTAVVFAAVLCIAVFIADRDFRYYARQLIGKVKRKAENRLL